MYFLKTNFQPKGDQPNAIKELLKNIKNKCKNNVLFGATGTGKTFTVANVITKLNKKVLIISHNKTLAMQIFAEMKNFFPQNKVEYFISPFDFYQPEAYLPSKDIYIDKSVKWNLDIRKMRMNALNALSTNESVIVVSTVAAIYGTIDPEEYQRFIFNIYVDQKISQSDFIKTLIRANYERNDYINDGSKFMVKGNVITIGLINNDNFLRVIFEEDKIIVLDELESITFKKITTHQKFILFPGNEYVVNMSKIYEGCSSIEKELKKRIVFFNGKNQLVESYRIKTRTEQDLEELKEFGVCKGIENYSLHFDKRQPGDPAFTIIDYFGKDFLTIIDESHVTIPQVRGMYLGDRSRKQNLVDFGFRLPTALDNRPLKFHEFENKLNNVIYLSATPGDYELYNKNSSIVEQIVRPTGLLDPKIEIKKNDQQIIDIIQEIKKEIKKKHRVFVLTLTIQMAEDLTKYLQEKDIKVAYLHSRLKTFERTRVLINLRKGIFDVVVGINLLREGLDIPEIALVAILDADKSGFLRDSRSLIQMVGRASRNKEGRVILYAEKITKEMKATIDETQRRRNKQILYNKKNKIIPQNIEKPIDDIFMDKDLNTFYEKMQNTKKNKITKWEKKQMMNNLNQKMKKAIKKMNFELAAKIRDMMFDLMKNNF